MKYLSNINSPKDLKKLKLPALECLAEEIRAYLIDTISRTGGHLASNLGVVECTIALHYCYQSPKDKLIWDVGHQSYVHKMLTGRLNQFNTLRKHHGLSGFPKGDESLHDAFDTGHSSTSISAALGYAVTRDLKGEQNQVVAVIGDGAMTGGLAFEALNNAGRMNTDLLVVLNDNEMSISENVGAISKHLNQIRTAPSYLEVKEDVNHFLKKVPVLGDTVGKVLEKTKDSIKYLLLHSVLFEEMGFTYIGPVDGHNIEELIKVFQKVKKMKGPVMVHVFTKKGKGYIQAENAPSAFHGVDSFDIETGKPIEVKLWDTYSDVFGKTLAKLADNNEKIVAVTAAMPSGTGLSHMLKKHPKRVFDVGIAEQHAVTFSAGMAKNGFIPVFAVYSTFLQRAYDQIVHDVCIQNLHVVFAIDRAGIVGPDGETHQGIMDLSYLSHMPNMCILAPKNKYEFINMIRFSIDYNGPIAIRYPRGSASRVLKHLNTPIEYGKSEIVEEGKDIVILSVGHMMDTAVEVCIQLQEKGYEPGLINVRFVKPVDKEMVAKLFSYRYVFVLEDNLLSGGCGSKILEAVTEKGSYPFRFCRFGFPDKFVAHGTMEELYKEYGLDVDSIVNSILKVVEGS